MITYLASKNEGKLAEIRTMLAGSPLVLETFPDYRDPEEGHESYVDNALLKARALRSQLRAAGIADAAVLADDSGIELDALGGGPGVDSAIYAGARTSWPDRLATMMREVAVRGGAARGARFVCVMALILPDGREVVVRGDVRGEIAPELRGTNGFGYDPLFYYPPIGKTFGQIPEAEKNELSHRGRAARALIQAVAT
ncbi:MAG TPA: non-canonical purine NTP pyrophosphatase [Candidatus Baltobacteraceae bacterium]|nr:non-canonical purine NTP pyrophosphatase [Candidatus Baltobacteraceae bacterium]